MTGLRMGSLFAGYEGLGLGVSQVLDVELAWVSEYEPPTEKNPNPSQAAAKIIAHHYPDVPNHGDITAIDWTTVEPVDLLTGGYPCQPFSTAGKRLGEADERYLWPEVERAIRHLGPRLVVLENVAGHVNRGFSAVLGSLASIGYDARWMCLQAADIGAPHRRERLFVVAWPAADAERLGRDWWPHEPVRRALQGVVAPGGCASPGRRSAPANTSSDGRHEGRTEPAGRGAVAPDADSDTVRQQPVTVGRRGSTAEPGQPVQWGLYEPAIRRWERVLGRVAPPPTEPGRTGAARLSPRFVEWMQGLDDGWVTAVPDISRNDQLKALGNGVCPQQCAEAMRRLLGVPERRAAA